MRETEILIVRHPETVANTGGIFVGRGDSPYTREGRRQLVRVPRKVARFDPQIIWSSPLTRALKLAEKVAAASVVPLRIDDRLVELDFGQAEGMTFEQIAEAGLSFNYRSNDEPVAAEGESRGDIERRSAAFCDQIVKTGGRHCVVTHGGVVRSALIHLLGLRSDDIWAFHVHNAQMAHVLVVDGHAMLESYVQG